MHAYKQAALMFGVVMMACPILSTTASAADNDGGAFVVLGASASSSMTAVGNNTQPRVMIDFGDLRTGEPKLPGGLISRADRMRLRAERAEARRLAIEKAKR